MHDNENGLFLETLIFKKTNTLKVNELKSKIILKN